MLLRFLFVIFPKAHALQIECHTNTDFSCFKLLHWQWKLYVLKLVIGFVFSSSAYNNQIPTEWNVVASNFITLSRAKLDITLSFNFTSRIQIISDKKHISWSPLHLGSTSIFQSHYDDDMIGVAFYKRCRPYKSFKFKAQIGGLFRKTLEGCYHNKIPDSHSAAIPNKQLAQQESRKLRRKF